MENNWTLTGSVPVRYAVARVALICYATKPSTTVNDTDFVTNALAGVVPARPGPATRVQPMFDINPKTIYTIIVFASIIATMVYAFIEPRAMLMLLGYGSLIALMRFLGR
jgi:hypothetical protein